MTRKEFLKFLAASVASFFVVPGSLLCKDPERKVVTKQLIQVGVTRRSTLFTGGKVEKDLSKLREYQYDIRTVMLERRLDDFKSVVPPNTSNDALPTRDPL